VAGRGTRQCVDHDVGSYSPSLLTTLPDQDRRHRAIPRGCEGGHGTRSAASTRVGDATNSTPRLLGFEQRHFIVADPNGVLIDVITPIPPTYCSAYAEQYVGG
jgi:hypothetical protein